MAEPVRNMYEPALPQHGGSYRPVGYVNVDWRSTNTSSNDTQTGKELHPGDHAWAVAAQGCHTIIYSEIRVHFLVCTDMVNVTAWHKQ